MSRMVNFVVLFFIGLTTNLYSQSNWEYLGAFPDATDFPPSYGQGIAVDGEGKIWYTSYYSSDSLLVPEHGDTTATGADTTIAAAYRSCRAIYVFHPNGIQASFSPIKTITVNGNVDTLWNSNRGLRTAPDGNVVAGSWCGYYKIDHLTGAGLASLVPYPRADHGPAGNDWNGESITAAAFDDAGNMFVCTVLPGFPIKAFDSDWELIDDVVAADNHIAYSRTIEVSADGNDIYYCGFTAGVGYIRFHSDAGVDGDYMTTVDTLFPGLSVEGVGWDPDGNIWGGNTGGSGFTNCGFYAYDPVTNAIVDSMFVPGVADLGGKPRSIDFNSSGTKAYVTFFNSWDIPAIHLLSTGPPDIYPPTDLTITQIGWNDVGLNWSILSDSAVVQYNVYHRNDSTAYSIVGSVTGNPPTTTFIMQDLPHGMQHYFRVTAVNSEGLESTSSNVASIYIPIPTFSVDVGEADAFPTESVSLPIYVIFPVDSSFSSMEISLGGFQDFMAFTGIDTQNSLIGNTNWTYAVNETDSLLITAWAGSGEISGEGVLFWLDFTIPDPAEGFIPVVIDYVMFDEVDIPIETLSGGVNIFQLIPGDVSLDGEVHAYDASLILKYLVGLEELDHFQQTNANVTMDTTISALDASMILQYVVALLDSLPYDTSNGLYSAFGNVTMSDYIIYPGQPIVIPLYLSNGSNIYSFEADFRYNSEHLTFNEILWSQIISGFTIETNESDNMIHIAGANTSPDGQQGVFLTLVYTVNDDFSNTETNILLQKLRWNEEPLVENAAFSVLTNFLNTGENSSIPQDFALHPNYPNPFNPSTQLRYDLPEQAFVQLTIYDLLGRRVTTLVNRVEEPGYRSVIWNGTNANSKTVSAGMYLYVIKAGDFVQTRKMVLIK